MPVNGQTDARRASRRTGSATSGTGDIPITLPPGHVRISGIDLPWGDVFAIAFKFCVVLALFQAVFLIVAVLLWR
jgi:hypothetical protein